MRLSTLFWRAHCRTRDFQCLVVTLGKSKCGEAEKNLGHIGRSETKGVTPCKKVRETNKKVGDPEKDRGKVEAADAKGRQVKIKQRKGLAIKTVKVAGKCPMRMHRKLPN